MDHFEHNFDDDKDNDDPLEAGAVLVTQVVVDHVHHLGAVVQLLVNNLSSLGYRWPGTATRGPPGPSRSRGCPAGPRRGSAGVSGSESHRSSAARNPSLS